MAKPRRKVGKPRPSRRAGVGHHLKRHFIPHEGNGHLPHALRHRSLFAYSALLIAVKAVAVALPLILPAGFLQSSAVTESNIIQLTNEGRASAGIDVVTRNATLTAAAQAKADDMMVRQYFSHVDPDGKRGWNRILAAGYDYRYAGENLAIHFKTAESVHAGWLASATHKANLVDPRFREIGVGIAHGAFEGHDTTVVVQFFGTPRTAVGAVTEPQPAETPVKPAGEIVEDASLTPNDDGILVQASAPNAEEVRVLGEREIVALAPVGGGDWSGTITPKGDESWRIITRSGNGEETVEPLATFYAQAETPEVFAAAAAPSPTDSISRWLTQERLENGVNGFYVYVLVFLVSAMLLTFFVRIRVQHWSVLAHASAVTGLALFLLVL